MSRFVATYPPQGNNTFTRTYFEAMEWTDCNSDNPELASATAWAPELIASAVADCTTFQEANTDDLAELGNDEQAGVDFWLTRNGHGAGFWDRGNGALGDRLAAAAKIYGTVDLYAGDDGLIYGS
jgi:hypothetical protein